MLAREDDVRIRKHEAAVHLGLGVEQRGEDVVVGPVGIVDEAQRRPAAGRSGDPVAEVAAHDHDIVDARGGERVELPVQDRATADGQERFLRVVGQGRETAGDAGGQDDRRHPSRVQLADSFLAHARL